MALVTKHVNLTRSLLNNPEKNINMATINIEVNNTQVEAKKGDTILDVAKNMGINIPTLCHLKDLTPTGACRMCVVEVEGANGLVPSCSFPVADGMKINTHSNKVVEARKMIVELLLANHPDDCLYCPRNKQCELQTLADDLNVNERRFQTNYNTKLHVDQSSTSIVRDPAKCILCGRCVRVCEEIEAVSAIDFINRGSHTVIGTSFDKGMNTSSCVNCGQCIQVCPTGALALKNDIERVQDALQDPEMTVVVQHAPAVSVTLGEEFNVKPGKDIAGIMHAAFRKIGFDNVFETSFSADLTIIEEANELLNRINKGGTMPMFTSCCPAWVKYVEEFYPDMLDHVSSCKSPQQMLGAVVKSYYANTVNVPTEKLFHVSVMPCTAKKFEAAREEMVQKGIADVDAVLTTRELASLIKLYNIDMNSLKPENADSPMGTRSSAGKIFGASGGVMEAALRTAHFSITGENKDHLNFKEVRGLKGRKEAKIKIGDVEVGVAVVSGLKNAEILMEEIKAGKDDVHFIEVMACPGGCINGGGQPLTVDEEALKARMKCLYEIDKNEALNASHNNPEIKDLYDKFLKEPLGEKSHHLLHTTYRKRNKEVLL